jgi:O-acetyl-ADP-ribose deacetylase (regulator of RNase III)
MKIAIFVGDLADADADAVCTSTNARLSLMMGTGAAIRERGGSVVSRACEAIVAAHGPLPAGTAHATTAGMLPFQLAIHCVASDQKHRSSAEIVRSCVRSAIAIAVGAGCASIALPLFGAGHARLPLDVSLTAIAEEIRGSGLSRIVIVIPDEDDANTARRMIQRLLGVKAELTKSTRVAPEEASWFD